MPRRFIQADNHLIPVDLVTDVDITGIERQEITVSTADDRFLIVGFQAIEAIMILKPSALEGRRLRWARNTWAYHNAVIHPVMQVMVWLGFKRAAIALHDRSIPMPTGFRYERR